MCLKVGTVSAGTIKRKLLSGKCLKRFRIMMLIQLLLTALVVLRQYLGSQRTICGSSHHAVALPHLERATTNPALHETIAEENHGSDSPRVQGSGGPAPHPLVVCCPCAPTHTPLLRLWPPPLAPPPCPPAVCSLTDEPLSCLSRRLH